MRLLQVRSGHIERLAYSPDGSHLAASANPWGRVWLWHLRAGEGGLLKEKDRPFTAAAEVSCPLTFSPSGELLAFGGERQVSLRDLRTGLQPYFRSSRNHQCRCLAFTPDGETLVSAGTDPDDTGRAARVALWDVRTGRKRELTLPYQAGSRPLAITADAALVLWSEPPAPRAPAHLTLWHVPGRQWLSRSSVNTPPAYAAFSPTGRRLAVAAEANILLYDIGHILDYFGTAQRSSPWASLTFPLRWKRFASRRVPMASPQQLEGHRGPVLALAFTPDGQTLLSGGRDRTVRCWDLASLRQREAWAWPVGVVYSLAVAPDGLTAAAGGNAGRTAVWDLTWF